MSRIIAENSSTLESLASIKKAAVPTITIFRGAFVGAGGGGGGASAKARSFKVIL